MGQICGTIFGVSGGVVAIVVTFFLPFLHRKLIKEDWTLRWYHIFLGPALLKRGPVPDLPAGQQVEVVQDYYRGKVTRKDLEQGTTAELDVAKDGQDIIDYPHSVDIETGKKSAGTKALDEIEKEDAGAWWEPKNLPRTIIDALMHGVRKDVVAAQNKESRLLGDVQDMHARAAHFDNKTEHLYSFLQVLTAATSSFAHGANDVSNAIGPLSTIYMIWLKSEIEKKAQVPLWVLAYGGAAIVIGLWTYGYNIMRNLGNRITLHSPSRGFSMELGSAVTVVMATRLALPVSTTQVCPPQPPKKQ